MNNSNGFKADFSAGFTVALVALPLSIGVALASGAPASAGIIAAVVGGLLGSWMGGCQVTINGPAAGLIVIVLDAVVSLGHGDPVRGMKGMLAASVVAGAIQVIFGFAKLGRKGSAFPASVIHGMMAAIGLIIIAKHVHLLFGYTPEAKNPILLYTEIPKAIMNLNPKIFLVGFTSLAFLIFWSRLKSNWTKKLPAPLLTIMLGGGLAYFLGFESKNLLQIESNFVNWIIFPDFSVMSSFAGWKAAITLALVGSIETVLSASAVDKLDPHKRKSDLDRDLLSKGICNMVSASVGGLPMIAEIVRSSANVSYGAQTWRANFVHATVILGLVLAAPNALSMIPLASLAAILIMVGSRLGSPAHFLHAYKIGRDNLVGFVVTMIVTLSVDLLMGIILGAVAQFLVEYLMGLKVKNTFEPRFEIETSGLEVVIIRVESALTFSNFFKVRHNMYMSLNDGKHIHLELQDCQYIDNSVMEELENIRKAFSDKKMNFKMSLSEKHHPVGNDVCSSLKKSA